MYLLRCLMSLVVLSTAFAAAADDGGADKEKPAIELEEIEVVAKVPEMVQRGDTTVINAAAFKVPEGSMLEELVKRIPGLEFDQRNYTMTYNGRPITEINLNGEVFFSGDNKLALTNLPVAIIEKIKVYNKQSDESKYTGLKDRTDNLVLDVNTKKSFDGAVTGEANAAGGTERRRAAGVNVHCFKTNGDALAADFKIGNLDHTSANRRNLTGNLGLHFNKKFDNGIKINASVSGNGNRGGDESANYSEQYLPSENRYQNQVSGSYYDSKSLSGHLGVRWEIDDKTYIGFHTSLDDSKSDNENDVRQAVYSENPGLDLQNPFDGDIFVDPSIRINGMESRSKSKSTSGNYSVGLNALRRFGSKGFSVALSVGARGGENESKSHYVSQTDFYRLSSAFGGDSVLYRNQYRVSPGHSSSYNAGAGLTYPLHKNLRINISYSVSASRSRSSRSTYGLPMTDNPDAPLFVLPDHYQQFIVDSLSDSKHSHSVEQNISLFIQYSRDPLLLTASISAQPRRNRLDQLSGVNAVDTVIRRVLLRPTFHGEWNKGNIHINFNYDGNTRAPSVSDLISVADNSNPLYITRANPDLKCSYTHSFRLGFNHDKAGVSASADFSNEWNTITRAVIYNPETGGRITEPRNINGNYSFNGMARYYKRFGHCSASVHANGSMVRNVSYVSEGIDPEPQQNTTDIKNLSVGLMFSYTPSWGGFYLNGSWSGNYSTNSFNATFTRTNVISCSLSAFARLPFGFRVESNIAGGFRGGNYSYAGRRNSVMWTAGLSRIFFKKQQLEVGLRWHDILNQKVTTSINTTATAFSESYIDRIGGYILLTAKFRFSTTKEK